MLTIKENAKILHIKEQIIWQDACGLTIEFSIVPNDTVHPYRLRLYGEALKYGNREFTFNPQGVHNGGGTSLQDCPFPFD